MVNVCVYGDEAGCSSAGSLCKDSITKPLVWVYLASVLFVVVCLPVCDGGIQWKPLYSGHLGTNIILS